MSVKTARRSNWKFEFDFTKGAPQIRYTKAQEKALVIERYWKGQREVITFAMAYSELTGWLNKSFSNSSDLGFSDALFEMFRDGSTIHTPKADYRLWNSRKFAADKVSGRSN